MLVFLYGPDTYRLYQKQLLFEGRFLSEGGTSSGICRIDCEDLDAQVSLSKFRTFLTTKDLFITKKLIIVRGLFGLPKDKRDEIADFFAKEYKDDGDTTLIIRESAVDKKFRIFKVVKKRADEAHEFPFLRDEKNKVVSNEFILWAKKYSREKYPALEWEEEAFTYIVEQSSGESFRFVNEIEKLSLLFLEQKKIRKEDVHRYIARTPSSVIWTLLDSLGSGNRGQSLDLVLDQYEQGITPQQIFSMIFYRIFIVSKVLSLYEEEGVRNNNEIATKVHIHPFVVQKIIQGRIHMSLERIKKMIILFARLDIAVKSGKIDEKTAVEEFLFRG